MLGQTISLTISNLIITYLEQLRYKKIVTKKTIYSGYGITVVSAGSWSLDQYKNV